MNFIQNTNSIGMKNESSLHIQIKQWYFQDGDKVEVPVGSYIIDIVRENLLIEIQTKNFSAMKRKLKDLLNEHKVRVIHPIAVTRHITYLTTDSDGNVQHTTRKSPKKGTLLDVFNELIRITDFLDNPNLELEILLIHEEELRCNDGKGSWRRKGVSITDRQLKDVHESYIFKNKQDYLNMLPPNLPEFFTTKTLAKALGIKVNTSRKIAYCLKKINIIRQIGKEGNMLVYTRCLININC